MLLPCPLSLPSCFSVPCWHFSEMLKVVVRPGLDCSWMGPLPKQMVAWDVSKLTGDKFSGRVCAWQLQRALKSVPVTCLCYPRDVSTAFLGTGVMSCPNS